MVRLRALVVLLFGLVLMAGSVTVAVAELSAATARTVEICTGTGVAAVALGPDGRPVGPVHPCPKCLAGLLAAAIPPAMVPPARPVTPAVTLRPGHGALPAGPREVAPSARGPPASLLLRIEPLTDRRKT